MAFIIVDIVVYKCYQSLLLMIVALILFITRCLNASGCVDEHPKCNEWADKMECYNNPDYMMCKCSQSCNTPSICGSGPDTQCDCAQFAMDGLCTGMSITECPTSCNLWLDNEFRCTNAPNITHAHVLAMKHRYQEKLTYACDEGYDDIADKTCNSGFGYICMESGVWQETIYCTKIDCQPITCNDPLNVPLSSWNGTSIKYGEIIAYSCNHGYHQTGGDYARECQANKSWTGNDIKCEVIKCPAPSNISNAKWSGDNFTFGAKVVFWCDEGFEIVSGNIEKTCSYDGLWNGENLTCGAIQAPLVNAIESTSSSLNTSAQGNITPGLTTKSVNKSEKSQESTAHVHEHESNWMTTVTASNPSKPTEAIDDDATVSTADTMTSQSSYTQSSDDSGPLSTKQDDGTTRVSPFSEVESHPMAYTDDSMLSSPQMVTPSVEDTRIRNLLLPPHVTGFTPQTHEAIGSVAIGVVGILMVAVVVGIIFCLDLATINTHLKRLKLNLCNK